MTKVLAYYTVGYNSKYIELLELSIKSLQMFNPDIDILVLCDESMVTECKNRLPSKTILITMADSKSPQESSMHKVYIFDYPIIKEYEKVIFIDSDIIIHTNLQKIFNNVTESNKLYAGTETTSLSDHKFIYWSLENYTSLNYLYFSRNFIYPFNAGCFAFIVSPQMENHFKNIVQMIKTHTGKFYYEQSFMNVYFNLRNLRSRNAINNKTYVLFASGDNNESGKILHFCSMPGTGDLKLEKMQKYFNNYLMNT